MGWQSGRGGGEITVNWFWGYVEIVILDVGLTLKDEITFEELRWFQGLSIEGAHIYYTVHE